MRDIINDFVNRRHWAVVGVSSQPRKYGNIIYHNLRRAGYKVDGIHPTTGELDGDPIYPTLADLPDLPEVVDIVVPPDVTEQIVRECHALGLTRVWMQPGAESRDAVAFCLENGIEVVYGGPCAMVEKRTWR